MSAQPTSGEFSSVCSYLGLADDADSHATYATEAHRCYRLPNPTRIAAGHQESYCLGAEHQTCPVYQGEGVPRPAAAAAPPPVAAADPRPSAAAAASTAATAAAPGELRPKSGPSPFGGNRPAGTNRPGTTRPAAARRPGLNNPRPRAGGISMPTLTIALFGLALVILGAALAVSFLAGGGDDGDTPAGQVGVNQTNTALAQTPNTSSSTTPRPSTTAGANQTPGANTTTTPGAGQTPGTGADTYTVQAGDFCGTIADDHGISPEQFFALNPSIDANCQNLQVGQVVKVR